MALTREEYLEGVRRTYPGGHPRRPRLINFTLGLCGETAELYAALVSFYDISERITQVLDPARELSDRYNAVSSEFGDCLWYLFATADMVPRGERSTSCASPLFGETYWRINVNKVKGDRVAVLNQCNRLARLACRFAEVVKKYAFHGKDVQTEDFVRHLYEYAYAFSGLYSLVEPNKYIADLAQENIDKLRARYPDGFKTS